MILFGRLALGAGYLLFYWYFYAVDQSCYHPHQGLNTCGYGDIVLPPEPMRTCNFSDVGC